MKIKLEGYAFMPLRAHEADAGLDIRTPKAFTVQPGDSAVIDTGVHIGIPEGNVGFLKSKSGLNVKYGITSEGVIDAGYTGVIMVKLYNHGKEPVRFTAGDKISQLVVLPLAHAGDLEEVEELEITDRGSRGFGSSGR